MRGLRRVGAGAACLLIVAGVLGCSGQPPQGLVVHPPTEAIAAVLLVGIHAALEGDDPVEAARLAELAGEAALTDEQSVELAALVEGFADDSVVYAAPSGARASDVASGVAAEALPFFDAYRDDADGTSVAWFALGPLSVSETDIPPPSLHRRGARRDRVVVLDFGLLLSEAGVDDTTQRYHGVTRVRHGKMLHHYVDADGRATTGVTRAREDGSAGTALYRYHRP